MNNIQLVLVDTEHLRYINNLVKLMKKRINISLKTSKHKYVLKM